MAQKSTKAIQHLFLAGAGLRLLVMTPEAVAAEPGPNCKPLAVKVDHYRKGQPGVHRSYITTVAPGTGEDAHANPFFQVNTLSKNPIQSVFVKLTPLTTDVGLYPSMLIARYSDDSIFESAAPNFTPSSTKPILWGPLVVNQPDKRLAAFNVKILENFRLIPQAKGFTFKLEVFGCR
jgi:hypothetical protein